MTLDGSCPSPAEGQSKEIKRKKDEHNLGLKVAQYVEVPFLLYHLCQVGMDLQ